MEDKQEGLKAIIRKLHGGMAVGEVKREFADLIKGVSAEEIAAMEQALIDEGFPPEEIQRLCEVHVQVFESSLEKGRSGRTMPGHPAHSLKAENREAERRLRALLGAARSWVWSSRLGGAAAAGGVPDAPDATDKGGEARARARAALRDLDGILVHFARKENQLFPYLERHGFTGPSKVMWGKHDEIRAALKELSGAVEEGPGAFRARARSLAAAMRRMFFMEERILLPNALRKLSEREWAEIRRGEEAIGFAWIKPGAEYDAGLVLARTAGGSSAGAGGALAAFVAAAKGPGEGPGEPGAPGGGAATPEAAMAGASAGGAVALNTGSVSAAILDLALRKLPLDISIVDAQDRVLYYSDSPDRLFPRSPAVIGRVVHNCHPQKSVAMVERILEAFKKGERDSARFWMELGGKFVVIEYFALRDAEGNYVGTLETGQDATGLRSLQGQRRLLEWD
jgi:uncharacterized protein